MPESVGEVVLDEVATWKEAPPNALELMKEAAWILGPKHTGGGEEHARAVVEAFLDRGWTDPTPDARYAALWKRIPSGPLEEALWINTTARC